MVEKIKILESKADSLSEQNAFKSNVLNWVRGMQIGPTQFKMNESSDGTIFTSCFALFIFDLFGEVGRWTQEEKERWIEYINSFQDKESGYFIPAKYRGGLDTKTVQQLTCFCLSALDILGSSPKHELSFLKKWRQPEDIRNYLKKIGCFAGKPMTGNMAMFLAIFLTYQYEKYKDESLMECLDSWFHWHNETQNKSTGFWGNSVHSRYYSGFQNAFHQYIVYSYWKKPIPCFKTIIDTILLLQDKDGYFGPAPGGGACWDYDAVHILAKAYRNSAYRRNEIEESLKKAFHAIRRTQNADGGFCQSKKRMKNVIDFARYTPFYFRGNKPYLWYPRIITSWGISVKREGLITTEWTEKERGIGESNLWDTWLRCLSLAEISQTVEIEERFRLDDVNFHKIIGLGYFNKK